MMLRVLVIDDDQSCRLLIEDQFSELGYMVVGAESGREGLLRAADQRPDVVILDVNMPGMDGLETLSRLASGDKSVPVILWSAYSSYKDDLMTWAADAYVIKSGDLTELKAAVREVLLKRGLEEPTPGTAPSPSPTEVFDVFICYSSRDRAVVTPIVEQLRGRGLRPWFDQSEIRPGTVWLDVLEASIDSIGAAAVFVGADTDGKSAIGPWQRREVGALLRRFVEKGCPVVPVLLPGLQGEPELPLFLRDMHWVGLSDPECDPIDMLIWGITGKKPADR